MLDDLNPPARPHHVLPPISAMIDNEDDDYNYDEVGICQQWTMDDGR